MTAYGWEREEWRCAVEAAEDAGEFDDRPTKADFYGDDHEEEVVDDDYDE